MAKRKTSTLSASAESLVAKIFDMRAHEKSHMSNDSAYEPLLDNNMLPVNGWEHDRDRVSERAAHNTTKQILAMRIRENESLKYQISELHTKQLESEDYHDSMVDFKDKEIARLRAEIYDLREASRSMEVQFSTLQAQKDHLQSEVVSLQQSNSDRIVAEAHARNAADESAPDYLTTADALAQCGRYVRRREHMRYLYSDRVPLFSYPSRRRHSGSTTSTSSSTDTATSPLQTLEEENFDIKIGNDTSHEPQAIVDAALALERDLDRRGSRTLYHAPDNELNYKAVYGVHQSVAWHLRQCSMMIQVYECRAKLHFLWGPGGERDDNGQLHHDPKLDRLFDGLQQRAEQIIPSINNPPLRCLNKDEAARFTKLLRTDKQFQRLWSQYSTLHRRKLFKAKAWRDARERDAGRIKERGKGGGTCFNCGESGHLRRMCPK